MPLFKLGFLDAVAAGDITLARSYLEKNPEKYLAKRRFVNLQSAIEIAAENCDVAMIDLLCRFDKKPELNLFYKTQPNPLASAATSNKPLQERAAAIRRLVEKGADINHKDYFTQKNAGIASTIEFHLLDFVIKKKKFDILPTLIELGIDLKANTDLITRMIEDGRHGDAIRECVKAGADFKTPVHPDTGSPIKYPPSFTACRVNRPDIVIILRDAGADITAPGIDWRREPVDSVTPYAFKDRSGLMLKLLLEAGGHYAEATNEWHKLAAKMHSHDLAIKTFPDIYSVLRNYKPQKEPKLSASEAKTKPVHAEAPSPWKKLDDESVAHVKDIPALQRRVTQIFNFKAQERQTLTENLAAGTETSETKMFSEIGKEGVLEAAKALEQAGGTIDREKIFSASKKTTHVIIG